MNPQSETRVLDAFEPGLWVWQSAIVRASKMDTSTCLSTLRGLVAAGVLEFGLLERQGFRGRRRHIYRLAMRGKAAA